jgi:hypothetical protein
MQRIFDDERRRNGAFARGPSGVGPKSFLNVSEMLDVGRHRLALSSCSETISAPTQPRALMFNRP